MTAQSIPVATENQVRVWDLPLRLFHWLLVAAVAVAFLSSEEGNPLAKWHIASGWTAALFIAFRLVWGLVGGEHARFASFVRLSRIGRHLGELLRGRTEPKLGHNPLGALSVVLLLAFVAATVWTGATISESTEDRHEAIAYALLALIALHVLAVILMSLLAGENLVRAMITGRKPAARHPLAHDARRPHPAALLFAALVVAATVHLITRYDPVAFELRAAETAEHEAAFLFSDAEDEEADEID